MSKTVEETNRTLTNMYEWRDSVVNKARQKGREMTIKEQKEAERIQKIEEDTERFRVELETWLNEVYDDPIFSKMNEMFLQFVMITFDLDVLYTNWTDEDWNFDEGWVELHYFMFRETIGWYDTSEYK